MSIAKTNRAILQRYRCELDELRAARLASVETDRELRDEIDVLYADACAEGERVGGLTRSVVRLGDTVIALGEQLRRADGAARVRLDALEATAAAGRKPKGWG